MFWRFAEFGKINFELKQNIMKITVSKVKRELKNKHGWDYLENKEQQWFVDKIIKDIIDIINDELLKHKNISIKK